MPTLSPDFLASIPIFRGMTDQERSQLLQLMKREHFDAEQTVYCTGEMSQGLHVILEGSAIVLLDVYGFANPFVEDGAAQMMDQTKISTLEIGTAFGELSFFSRGRHSATVRATSALELLTLPADDFQSLLARHNLAAYKLALNAAQILAERLRGADKMIGELVLASHDALARSAWYEGHASLHAGAQNGIQFFQPNGK